ncbi:MAG: BsaA family SipW-dependent biofilm matrix protein [Clostridiales bacterium]|nr:BsaA family SipW-dependent biofilm matrix protein [Clostridiales bacterium]
MKTQRNNRIRTLALVIAALSLLSMTGATFASRAYEMAARNEYRTAAYQTELVEAFESPDDWQPGMAITKEASIRNQGTLPVFCKVTLDQSWIRTKDVYDAEGNILPPAKDGAFPLTFAGGAGPEYAALIQWGDVVLLASGGSSIPSLRLGLPTVGTVSAAAGKWLLLSETPDAGGRYTLYYVGALPAGGASPLFIGGVRMNPGISPSVIMEKTVWDKANRRWVTSAMKNPTHSYENARYTLGVSMLTVQATQDALAEVFKPGSTAEQSVIDALGAYAPGAADIDSSYDDTAVYALYLDNSPGGMVFTPLRESGKAWFMSDLNMVPGGGYQHTLKIGNRSDKRYDLYMKASPLSQTVQLDELLGYISMKVYHGTELIYDGTAMGKDYPGGLNDLQGVICLGNYKPGDEKQLRAVLVLDKDTPIEYSGILTEIDWVFMAEEDPDKKAPDKKPPEKKATVSASPKTGDAFSLSWYALVMCISGICFAVCVIVLIAMRKRGDKAAR